MALFPCGLIFITILLHTLDHNAVERWFSITLPMNDPAGKKKELGIWSSEGLSLETDSAALS